MAKKKPRTTFKGHEKAISTHAVLGQKEWDRATASEMLFVAVMAGNHRQFLDYVRPKQADGITYVFCDNPTRIMGYRFDTSVVVGTFYELTHSGDIEDLVKRNMRHMI